MSLQMREVVKSLCCSNGWCYGLFWGVNPRNSMLLTLEDAYCEETLRAIIGVMLQQVHMLGEGIIGEAAVTGKHQWMFSDTSYRLSGPTGSVNNQEVFQDISEFHRHFSSGIKTIVLIPVAPLGVVQFGSTEKILESSEFVDHVKYIFRQLTTINRQLPVALNHDGYDPSSILGSETSFPNYVDGDSVKRLQENIQTAAIVPQPSSHNPELQNNDSTFLMGGSFPATGAEDSFVLPTSDMQDVRHLSQFSSSSTNMLESINPMWGGEQPSWTLFDQQMLSGMDVNESSGTNSLTPVACVNSFLNSQGDTGLASIPNSANNISHWVAESAEHDKNVRGTHINDNLSVVHGSAYSSVNNSVDNVNAVQSSLTNNTIGNENTNLTVPLPTYNDLVDSLGLEFAQSQRMECWEDYVWPVVSASHSSLSTGASECTDFDVGSNAAPQNEFLTAFRLEQLLEGSTSNNSMHGDQVNLASHACLGRTDTTNTERIQDTMRLNALVAPSIDDSYSINTESTSSRHSKKDEEMAKAPKKKCQPREGSRPRPKDRQQIQDRVKELREIVPTGGKCSIDALLDRTVKHMLFLQSVLKYADKLKNFDNPKIIGDEKGVILKDTSNGSDAIWAYGVAGQTMVCPMAEDTSPPGELSIEMRCDEGGYFLEIADTIRGFGLTILRGTMETEGDTIWARFTVEVTKDLTRMDVFLFLVQLVQQTTTCGNGAKNQLNKATDGGVAAFPNATAPMRLAEPLG